MGRLGQLIYEVVLVGVGACSVGPRKPVADAVVGVGEGVDGQMVG